MRKGQQGLVSPLAEMGGKSFARNLAVYISPPDWRALLPQSVYGWDLNLCAVGIPHSPPDFLSPESTVQFFLAQTHAVIPACDLLDASARLDARSDWHASREAARSSGGDACRNSGVGSHSAQTYGIGFLAGDVISGRTCNIVSPEYQTPQHRSHLEQPGFLDLLRASVDHN